MALGHRALAIENTAVVDHLDSANDFRRCNENALVTAAKNGETAAFDQLWQSHARKLLRTTYRITRNREDAGDALQRALLSAFVHIRRFDGRSSFATWLTRIAVNSALMIIRENKSAPQVSMDGGRDGSEWIDFEALREPGPDPEAFYTQREREAILADAIGELPPRMREALVLQKIEERSTREAAEILGISVSAAKARAFRARLILEKVLGQKQLDG
jgi:RNA polymerase sigma-70 factor (ECF subfamily)